MGFLCLAWYSRLASLCASGQFLACNKQGIRMLDVAFVLLGLVGFAACWGFVLLCERM
jgi:hypothetical protein